MTNADALWSSSLDDDLSDYREGLVDHWGEYEEGLYTEHYNTQQAAFVSSSDPLDGYQAAYAQSEMQLATAMRTQRNTYHDDVTTANHNYTDNRNAKRLLDLPLQQAAGGEKRGRDSYSPTWSIKELRPLSSPRASHTRIGPRTSRPRLHFRDRRQHRHPRQRQHHTRQQHLAVESREEKRGQVSNCRFET